ncbi:hypothetical protein EDD86DRAFT_201725 [Gorgonomyces haynaldii]|nr:hypothetical protein EDD86DRAFT_201725 [Gorgonomyces haynaldii]
MPEHKQKKQKVVEENNLSVLKHIKAPQTVTIIAASFHGGQPKKGVDVGPEWMLKRGLVKQLEGLGWHVNSAEPRDYEEKKPKTEFQYRNVKNINWVSAVAKDVHERVKNVVSKGQIALTLGGDHSLGMGTLSGTAAVHPNIGVIWVDAHADINTVDTTDSGNLHGCPVSFVMGLGPELEPFKWLKPCIKPDRIVYIGLRDVDAGEKKILKENNIKAFSMHEVDKYGIGKIMEMTFDYLGRDTPIHLSFDVDAMDPSVAPATGTPVRGGLTFREGHYLCESIFETGRLVSVDIMEVNPTLKQDEEELLHQTVDVGNSLARAALGETLL